MKKGRVGVLTTYHLHDDGQRIVYGGAERYGIEFSKMLREFGYDVAWWQFGSGWQSEIIPGVPLYSMPAPSPQYQTCPAFNQAFHEVGEAIDYAVYFTTLLAYPQAYEKSISISHGIYWDYPSWEKTVPTDQHRQEWYRRWWSALNRPTKVVSCDTATLRFINASWPGLASKLEYIPNFVDLDAFGPPQSGVKRDRLRVLYPRRLTGVRGIYETMASVERLSAERADLEFHIVGRGHSDHYERDMLRWAAGFPHVYYYWKPPSEMPAVYRNVDIALIPTKAAEGTSLSCLEAMASGCAVIAGCTGGLSDLVIDGHNGLLLRPLTAAGLTDAVRRLADDRELRERLSRNARATAAAFGLEPWKARWRRLLDRVFRPD